MNDQVRAQEWLVNRLIAAMKREFGADRKRVAHALRVLEHAREIQRAEGGDPLVIFAAAVLHDIGIQQAERKHGSSAGRYQEVEGPPIARRIMQSLALPEPVIEHVCRIIANHHSARDIETLEFDIVWDADWLVNLPEEFAGRGRDELQAAIDHAFRTKSGRRRAQQLFLPRAA